MTIAIRFRGEQQRAVGALVRLLPGMRERMTPQRRSPRKGTVTKVAVYAIRRRRVRALLLLHHLAVLPVRLRSAIRNGPATKIEIIQYRLERVKLTLAF